MKKSKKIILLIILIIVIVLLGAIIFKKGNNKIDTNINKIAEKEFGNDNCEAIVHRATRDSVEHTCKICNKKFRGSSMNEDICKECATTTGRCDFCGKILTNEIKEQREKLIQESTQK